MEARAEGCPPSPCGSRKRPLPGGGPPHILRLQGILKPGEVTRPGPPASSCPRGQPTPVARSLTSMGQAQSPEAQVRGRVGDASQAELNGVDGLVHEHLGQDKLGDGRQ